MTNHTYQEARGNRDCYLLDSIVFEKILKVAEEFEVLRSEKISMIKKLVRTRQLLAYNEGYSIGYSDGKIDGSREASLLAQESTGL